MDERFKELRKASEVSKGVFPYLSVPYIEVSKNGGIKYIAGGKKTKGDCKDILEALDRVSKKESRLICPWEGMYSTDVFEIDTKAIKEAKKTISDEL